MVQMSAGKCSTPSRAIGKLFPSSMRVLTLLVLVVALLWFLVSVVFVFYYHHLFQHHAFSDVLQSMSRIETSQQQQLPESPKPAMHPCEKAYQRAIHNRTRGLTDESMERSKAWIGNRERLSFLAQKLLSTSSAQSSNSGKVNVVTFGGSITLGNTVAGPEAGFGSYADILENELNAIYPLSSNDNHRVINLGAHGADMCALEKRLNLIILDLAKQNIEPDLVTLEFAVNDYEGQDDLVKVDSKTDVFFEGFQEIALCCEVVVRKLLHTFPRTAVMFLEFRSAIEARKTGTFLHMGVAQHYQVPVVSYAEGMFPEFFRLISMLNASDRYTVPSGETLLPFPYGCHDCYPAAISRFYNHFRPPDKKCRTVCDFINYAPDTECDMFKSPPPGRSYCHPPIFAVDGVHPSYTGHRIATDFVLDVIARSVREECFQKEAKRPLPTQKHVLPNMGWLAHPSFLAARGNFIFVNDTDCFLRFCNKLNPIQTSPGFTYYSDVNLTDAKKYGWIATSPLGNETITFELNLPSKENTPHKKGQSICYAIHLAILRSYRGMGQLQVTVRDVETGVETVKDLDGQWKAKISVWSDNAILSDKDTKGCTSGHCTVTVRTKPQIEGRIYGNKVKILTLSARECSPM